MECITTVFPMYDYQTSVDLPAVIVPAACDKPVIGIPLLTISKIKNIYL